MRITSARLMRYDLPLARPLTVRQVGMTVRTGLVLCLADEKGNIGYGEIAPLSGLHRETLQDALTQLLETEPFLTGLLIPDAVIRLDGGMDDLFHSLDMLPTVRFGIEMAVLNLMASSKGLFLHELFGLPFNRFVPVNGLLSGSRDEILKQARYLSGEGYVSVKIKVGKGDVASEIELIKEMRKIISANISIRLDANRAWTSDEAISLGKALSGAGIDYIEEPVRDYRMLEEFYQRTRIPFALDETLTALPFDIVAQVRGLKAVVIKPCVAGGVEKTVGIIKNAKNANITPVLSSAFNSGLGLAFIAQISAVFSPRDVAVGLDTFRWFKQDIFDFHVSNGFADVHKLAGKRLLYQYLKPCI